jgi:hypothetical protein
MIGHLRKNGGTSQYKPQDLESVSKYKSFGGIVTLSPPTPSTRPLTLAFVVTAVWFGVAIAAGAAGVFDAPPDTPPAAIGLAAAVPPLIVVGLLGYSARFRAWARALDLRFLTLLQTWRAVGLAFLALSVQGDLPAGFALPAGLGDIAVGLTAPLVAVYIIGGGRWARRAYVGWTFFGIADLITAVALGSLTAGANAGPMSVLPMSLIPTFGVPFTLALHAISLVNASGSDLFAGPRPAEAITETESVRPR